MATDALLKASWKMQCVYVYIYVCVCVYVCIYIVRRIMKIMVMRQ